MAQALGRMAASQGLFLTLALSQSPQSVSGVLYKAPASGVKVCSGNITTKDPKRSWIIYFSVGLKLPNMRLLELQLTCIKEKQYIKL